MKRILSIRPQAAAAPAEPTVELEFYLAQIGTTVYLKCRNKTTGEEGSGNIVAIRPDGRLQRCAGISKAYKLDLDSKSRINLYGE